jgi:multiple sugar transport system permease protein
MIVRRSIVSSLLAHAVLLFGAAFMLAPFAWMFVTSLKTADEIFTTTISFWPRKWGAAANYIAALSDVPLTTFMLNGVIVCLLIVIIQVAVAVPCAYALAKHEFKGCSLLMGLVLLGLLIPIQVPALPLYIAFAHLGLLDTYSSLIIPFSISVFAIFLLRQFFKTFPDEIIDAARLDGFSEAGIVWRIILPSSWPAISAFAIFSVVSHWNDLYWPLIMVTTTEMATPPLGLMFFRQTGQTAGNIGALMAGGTLVVAPLIVAFLFAQTKFIQGITMSGLK